MSCPYGDSNPRPSSPYPTDSATTVPFRRGLRENVLTVGSLVLASIRLRTFGLFNCYTLTRNVSVQLIVLQVHIQEALGLDLGPGNGYCDGIVRQANVRMVMGTCFGGRGEGGATPFLYSIVRLRGALL
jgi:hypothetical protein